MNNIKKSLVFIQLLLILIVGIISPAYTNQTPIHANFNNTYTEYLDNSNFNHYLNPETKLQFSVLKLSHSNIPVKLFKDYFQNRFSHQLYHFQVHLSAGENLPHLSFLRLITPFHYFT